MDLKNFEQKPVIGILRGVEASQLAPLIDACIKGNLGALEITLNTNSALDLISQAVKLGKTKLMIGAGTVLNLESGKRAVDAGASYLVSPIIDQALIDWAVKQKVAIFPGALTPNEIYRAWDCGASYVKVFPARLFGPKYFQEIKGPLNKIRLLACGGVTAENAAEYFQYGADAIAFGASIFKPQWLKNQQFDQVTQAIKQLLLNCP